MLAMSRSSPAWSTVPRFIRSIMATRLSSEKRILPSNRTDATIGFSDTFTTRVEPCIVTLTVLNSPVACSASTEAFSLAEVAASPTLSARYLRIVALSTCLLPTTEILDTVAACAASTVNTPTPSPARGATNTSASARTALRSSLVGLIMFRLPLRPGSRGIATRDTPS